MYRNISNANKVNLLFEMAISGGNKRGLFVARKGLYYFSTKSIKKD
jgi:hypothetical protein